MPDGLWLLPLLMAVASLLTCLVVMGILGTVLWRRLRTMRNQTEQRFAAMAQHMRLIETRLDRSEHRSGPTASAAGTDRSDPPAPAKTMISRAGLRPFRPEVDNCAETRPSPTLIAIPDLAVEGQTTDQQLESELGQRNAEVWSLAASGMPVEEIARQTNQPIGLVELIVGLYRQLRSSRGPTDHARSH